MISFLFLSSQMIASNFLHLLTSVVDVWFVSQIGEEAIAILGLGSLIYMCFSAFGLGIHCGIEYLVSYATGEKNSEKQIAYLFHGVIVAIIVAISLTLALDVIALNLYRFQVEPQLAMGCKNYLLVISISLLPSHLFILFRYYQNAKRHLIATNVALVFGNLANLFLNYVLISGGLGFPSMGVIGSAWATVISRTLMMLGLGIYIYFMDIKRSSHPIRWKFDNRKAYDLLGLGLPSALIQVAEIGIYAFINMLIGANLSIRELAAHYLLYTVVSMLFMIPQGISSTLAVTIGSLIGIRDIKGAKSLAQKGFLLNLVLSILSGLLLCIYPELIFRSFFGENNTVMQVAGNFVVLIALFQLLEGMQAVGVGALRGLGETKRPMLYAIVGYWIIALPMCSALSFYFDWRLKGIWTGLCLGLIFIGTCVFLDWNRQIRRLSACTVIPPQKNGLQRWNFLAMK